MRYLSILVTSNSLSLVLLNIKVFILWCDKINHTHFKATFSIRKWRTLFFAYTKSHSRKGNYTQLKVWTITSLTSNYQIEWVWRRCPRVIRDTCVRDTNLWGECGSVRGGCGGGACADGKGRRRLQQSRTDTVLPRMSYHGPRRDATNVFVNYNVLMCRQYVVG